MPFYVLFACTQLLYTLSSSSSFVGGPVRDENKNPSATYDIRLQTHQCIQNIEAILEDAGLTLNDVCSVFSLLFLKKAHVVLFSLSF